MYYNAGLPPHLEAEFNFINGHLFGRNLTLDEIMVFDTGNALRNLLVLRHDPYMFHQANVRMFQWPDPVTNQTADFSLLSLWLRYLTLVRALAPTSLVRPLREAHRMVPCAFVSVVLGSLQHAAGADRKV